MKLSTNQHQKSQKRGKDKFSYLSVLDYVTYNKMTKNIQTDPEENDLVRKLRDSNPLEFIARQNFNLPGMEPRYIDISLDLPEEPQINEKYFRHINCGHEDDRENRKI